MSGIIDGIWRVIVIWHLFYVPLFLPLLFFLLLFFPLFPLLSLFFFFTMPVLIWPLGLQKRGGGAGWMQNGQGVPHFLHDLQDVDAGGLKKAIWVIIAIVVVVVDFVAGNGAPWKCRLFTLKGAKCPMSSFLDLLLSVRPFSGSFLGRQHF